MLFARRFSLVLLAQALGSFGVPSSLAADSGEGRKAVPYVAPGSDEARQAMRGFRLPEGWKVELIAAEPHLANPVAFAFDEEERMYVVETFRLGNGVLDIRGRAGWPSPGYRKAHGITREDRGRLAEEVLDADLACRTVEDRERMLRKYFAENASTLERFSERVRLLKRGEDGRVTDATVFADGFDTIVDGLASGVLARDGKVWFANVPHLWLLSDSNGDGVADERASLHHGYGVRVGFLGHDLHGLVFGPDGRLYFSIGDRGANVVTREGTRIEMPDTGAVFRCEPDGSQLEVFAFGFRNPQELVFDAMGNLWTGDNNSDGGDQARWTYVVEGGDSGWRIGWQFLERPHRRGPWNAEGMWRPEEAMRIGYIIPPLANIGAGPSGATYGFGTGLPEELDGRFFMVDFRGGASGIWSISVVPKGAGYAVADATQLLWDALPTDVEVGPDGGLYWSDWVQGWGTTGKGRIYRAYDPAAIARPEVAQTRRLLGTDLSRLEPGELKRLLSHPDLRVRQRAQFALADQGAFDVLLEATSAPDSFGRLHGLWGLGQISRKDATVLPSLVSLLEHSDAEVRGQAAKVLGDARHRAAGPALERLLTDPHPRPRFFAAIALGRLGRMEAAPAVEAMLRANDDTDPFLRHAGVMAMTGCHRVERLKALAQDPSRAVRLAAVVALRRLEDSALAKFLGDSDPDVVLEAARAINDVPVTAALPELARLLERRISSEPLLRRVLNANLRVGGSANAEALARFAADGSAPEAARAEAIRHLAQLASPSGRDQITGLWRPLPDRGGRAAANALVSHLRELLSGPAAVQAEAATAAGALGLRGAAQALRGLVRDAEASSRARIAALRALGGWPGELTSSFLHELAGASSEAIRAEALRWQSRLGLADALTPIRTALEHGGVREKQAALTSLGELEGGPAADLLVNWLSRATTGGVPAELELELIEAAASHDAAPVQAALAQFRHSLASTNGVLERRFLLRGGDIAAGRTVFFEKAEAQCARCHRAGSDSDGGVVGPDLKDVGARQSREQILESLLYPNAAVAPGFESVMIETRDGLELSGTIQSESDFELVLNTIEEGTTRVKKADITFRKKGLSAMPEGLAELMTPRELRDLVEYLAGLRGG
jgi:quinoprotein glucose dehydrogenase